MIIVVFFNPYHSMILWKMLPCATSTKTRSFQIFLVIYSVVLRTLSTCRVSEERFWKYNWSCALSQCFQTDPHLPRVLLKAQDFGEGFAHGLVGEVALAWEDRGPPPVNVINAQVSGGRSITLCSLSISVLSRAAALARFAGLTSMNAWENCRELLQSHT